MDNRKTYYVVLDTETANGIMVNDKLDLTQSLVYDMGYAIIDKKGNIYKKRSFVNADIFCDYKEMMKSAYYAEKIPQYWEDIKNGTREIKSIYKIRKEVKDLMNKYNVKKVGAYNMGFDKRALNNVMRYTTKSFCRWFFPFGTEFFCIWHLATQTLLQQKTFFKMAEKNDWFSEKGNLLTNAEVTYNYIKKMSDFKEEHKGLEDVRIEIEIMAHCFKQHKKMNTNINTSCWRLVQKAYKEYKVA